MNNDVWKDFAAQQISHSMAHYITTIYGLCSNQGYARISDVARELEVTKGSASVQVKHLKEKGFVAEDDNRHLQLTSAGDEVAHQVMYTREVLVRFLHGGLGVKREQAQIDACKIEHLLSHDTCRRILLMVRVLETRAPAVLEFLSQYRHFKLDCPRPEECGVCEDVCMALLSDFGRAEWESGVE